MELVHVQNRISELLSLWVTQIKGQAGMSRTDLHHVSETILVHLLREVYGWTALRNLNTETADFPAIDLADDTARVAIQVTATADSRKIKKTLTRFVAHKLYERYDRLIVYILVEKKRYRGTGFDDIIVDHFQSDKDDNITDDRFQFDKDADILDYRDLLAAIEGFQIDRATRILEFLEANFPDGRAAGLPPDPEALARYLEAVRDRCSRAGGTVNDWVREEPRDRPAYWDDERFNGPNQPVVGVTWYEALAYCHWLTAALDDGHIYRLPSEAQWERAARGRAGWRYPWGDKWIESRANTKALGLNRTTPVGIFPDGGSAEGVLDLTGNVFEWCSTAYDKYPYDSNDGREEPGSKASRVLRGGAYWTDRSWARCASRHDYVPDYWNFNYGFRVARGPLSKAP